MTSQPRINTSHYEFKSGERSPRRPGSGGLAIANFLQFLYHELKLGRFPSPSPLTFATLPSMSLIPAASFTPTDTNLLVVAAVSDRRSQNEFEPMPSATRKAFYCACRR